MGVGMSTDEADPARAGLRPAVVSAVRRTSVMLMILGLVLIAVPAVAFADDTSPGRLDRSVQSLVDETPSGARDATLVVDWLGEPEGRALMVLAVAAICLLAGRRALAITAVVGSILVGVLTTALKHVVDRRIHDDFLSYPSGHTAALTAVGLVLGLLLVDVLGAGPILGTALVLGLAAVTGGVMAWAQIDLTAHYPTDTLGGFGSALLVIPVSALLIDRLGQRIVRRTDGTPA
jgi:membrane-associated phospholipid phosphatase